MPPLTQDAGWGHTGGTSNKHAGHAAAAGARATPEVRSQWAGGLGNGVPPYGCPEVKL